MTTEKIAEVAIHGPGAGEQIAGSERPSADRIHEVGAKVVYREIPYAGEEPTEIEPRYCEPFPTLP